MSELIQLSLVEDRSIEVQLPRSVVDGLWQHPSKLFEIRPSLNSDRFKLIAGGLIGVYQNGDIRIEVLSKIPDANIRAMLDPESTVEKNGPRESEPFEVGLIEMLASRLAKLMSRLANRGLRPIYAPISTYDAFLTGKWDIAAQIRESKSIAVGIHSESERLSIDHPMHQVPKTLANLLLQHIATESPAAKCLLHAIHEYSQVNVLNGDLFNLAKALESDCVNDQDERELHEFCRLILNGFESGSNESGDFPTFRSLDVHRVFENYVAIGLSKLREEFEVLTQPIIRATEQVFGCEIPGLRPDVLILKNQTARCVIDTKWKVVEDWPNANDLRQIVAYLHITRSSIAALIYPSDCNKEMFFPLIGGGILVIYKLNVTGCAETCHESLRGLVSSIQKRSRSFEV